MQKTMTAFVAVFVALSLTFFATLSSAQTTDIPIPDCTQWTVEKAPTKLHFGGNISAYQTTDLVMGKYIHPEHNNECVRYFLQSTGQMIWQQWQDVNKTYFASILLEDGTYYTVEHAVAGQRMSGLYNYGTNDLVQMDFAILTKDTHKVIKNRLDYFKIEAITVHH